MMICPSCKGIKQFIHLFIHPVYKMQQTGHEMRDCSMCHGTGRITLLKWILAKIGVR